METPTVKEAQILQEELKKVTVKMVTHPSFSDRDKEHILAEFQEHLSHEITFTLEVVDEIPRTPQGKFRFLISKVPIQF